MALSLTAFIGRMRAKPKSARELWLAGVAFAFGLLVLPLLIYVAGAVTLGPYEHGSIWSYLLDFLKGLFRPHLAYWLIVTGPFLLLCLVRGLRWLRKRLRHGATT
jgi:hypothetical protein